MRWWWPSSWLWQWWTLNKYSQQRSCKNEPAYCEKSKIMVASYELCILTISKVKLTKVRINWVIIFLKVSSSDWHLQFWLMGALEQVWDHPPQLPYHTLCTCAPRPYWVLPPMVTNARFTSHLHGQASSEAMLSHYDYTRRLDCFPE